MDRKQALESEIARLQAEHAALVTAQAQAWPREIVVYVHSSRETMYGIGEKLGLVGEALDRFSFACYEVGIRVVVQEDGETTILGLE